MINSNISEESATQQNRSYIVGREGHIYIGDPSVSRQHAEIRLIDGKIYLRDLGSSNGIFLKKVNGKERFQQGFVKPNQSILIGNKHCTVQSLLSTLGIIAD